MEEMVTDEKLVVKRERPRKHWLRRHPRIAVLSIAGAVALAATVPSAASFSSQVQATATVSAGTVAVTVNNSTTTISAPLSLPNPWKPGDSGTQTLTIKNTGTLPTKVDIAIAGQGATYLGSQLDTVITDGTSNTSGKANGLTLVGAGPIAPGATDTFTITFTLPANTPNTWQGISDNMTVTVTANQV